MTSESGVKSGDIAPDESRSGNGREGSLSTAQLIEKLLAQDSESTLADRDIHAQVLAFFGRSDVPGSTAYPFHEFSRDLGLWLDRSLALIDSLITEQVNEIIHNSVFQRLEASWRSLQTLVYTSYGRKGVKVRFLDISWSEITKDVNRAVEFDQSQLFQKVYSEEFDTPGGEPYGVIVADYDVAHKPFPGHRFDDIPTLERLAEIASASFSPILLNAAPELFGLERDFDYIVQPFTLHSVFKESEYIRWNRLRDHPDARFMGITLPRVLLRAPYTVRFSGRDGFIYEERSSLSSRKQYLWGGANFALARILVREFSEAGWFAHIRGVPRDQLTGGLVNDPLVDYFQVGPTKDDHKPSVDVILTDERERELSDLGFIPICQCYDLPLLAFHSTPSIFRNRDFADASARANERVASSLQHVLCGSRFAHYIKVMIRDKIGSYTRAVDCGKMIQRWLNTYTVTQEDSDWTIQARYPLRKAVVEVKDNEEKPGSYWASIQLQPHYQADSLVSELHLTTELTSGGRAT
ncbi:type VI secretion system protein [Oleiphilus messinensis]|uniref:Type VI secretion system protein n=1 Tax=Oleiphilus messinensis TaxID=141451 RepID=A0A1Y0IEY8_9GAMM|nr:type VI secretion system contractile sheath large subunit [Oleiphilus messinensis]ARU58820.1 type VI secretion system protein [Oleiphilus messinensis]